MGCCMSSGGDDVTAGGVLQKNDDRKGVYVVDVGSVVELKNKHGGGLEPASRFGGSNPAFSNGAAVAGGGGLVPEVGNENAQRDATEFGLAARFGTSKRPPCFTMGVSDRSEVGKSCRAVLPKLPVDSEKAEVDRDETGACPSKHPLDVMEGSQGSDSFLTEGISATASVSRRISPPTTTVLLEAYARAPPSPLMRHHHPELQDIQLKRTSSARVSSPLRGGLKQQAVKKDSSEDLSTIAAPRPHKRTSSKDSALDVSMYKRSSSRDSTTEFSLEARKSSPLRRTLSADSNIDTGHSAKRCVAGGECSRDSRINNRQPVTRRVQLHEVHPVNPFPYNRPSALKIPPVSCHEHGAITSRLRSSSRKSERSPLRRIPSAKPGNMDASKPSNGNGDPQFAEKLSINSSSEFSDQVKQAMSKQQAQAKRSALKEIPGNYVASLKKEMKNSFEIKDGLNKDSSRDSKTINSNMLVSAQEPPVMDVHVQRMYDWPIQTVQKSQPLAELRRSRSTKSFQEYFVFPEVQSLMGAPFEAPEGNLNMPASVSKAYSILQAIADMNMASSVCSNIKEI